jgi:hypothetical protein
MARCSLLEITQGRATVTERREERTARRGERCKKSRAERGGERGKMSREGKRER